MEAHVGVIFNTYILANQGTKMSFYLYVLANQRTEISFNFHVLANQETKISFNFYILANQRDRSQFPRQNWDLSTKVTSVPIYAECLATEVTFVYRTELCVDKTEICQQNWALSTKTNYATLGAPYFSLFILCWWVLVPLLGMGIRLKVPEHLKADRVL